MGIFLPELYEHFKNENIDAQYYATSWFITIFTSVFQYSLDSHLLGCFWDIFLIDGWKGFFRCCLWLMKYHEKTLRSSYFDDIL